MDNLETKFLKLKQVISVYKSAAVAFSGGVDSSFLARVTFDLLGEKALAVTISSPMMPESEITAAKKIAAFIGIRHIIINDNIIDEAVTQNPVDRCYYCKKIEFSIIKKIAFDYGVSAVFDGSNIDDNSDYRPGIKALSELSVISPLRDAALTKLEIRKLSEELNLETYNKPAYACLASRIPYGKEITIEKLKTIENAEEYLKIFGLRQVRVRHHDNICRIEIAPEERHKLFNTELLDTISKKLKSLGFTYICMELEGYKTGSLNAGR